MLRYSQVITWILLVQVYGQDKHKVGRKPCAPNENGEMDFRTQKGPARIPSMTNETVFCTEGEASGFPCDGVDLEAFLNLTDLAGGAMFQSSEVSVGGGLNDIWGWTSPDTGIEYALLGSRSGAIFIDLSTPTDPIVLGRVRTHTVNSNWFDIKVYENHAYIVSEARGHGMQIYDLTQLDSLPRENPNMFLQATAHYSGVGNTHNIVINEESGYAYLVGTSTCRGGLHMVDIEIPTSPKFAGCFERDGYVHDAQCVNYDGPDSRYNGKEICFCSNEDTVTIVDVTDKGDPKCISRLRYQWSRLTYTHQGWLTEDKSIFLMDDELQFGRTSTYIIDVTDLEEPNLITQFCQDFDAAAHNQYTLNNLTYQANYHSGLRILDTEPLSEIGTLEEVAYFDTFAKDNDVGFDGAWSSYPYYESGIVVISSIEEGFFVVRPHFNYENATTVRELHSVIVDDIDGKTEKSQSMIVTVTVYDHDDSPVNGARVTGAFYHGIKKTSCVTDSSGTCTVQSPSLHSGVNDVTFNVLGITYPRHKYNKKANTHTSIRMVKAGDDFETIKSSKIPTEHRKKSNQWAVSKFVEKVKNHLAI